ncbi:MAG: hypothetical protein OIF36_01065 [Alphaproteobacteria bacterium]|nr:hypothetical protein [Alphaproteobacteria bacterium]
MKKIISFFCLTLTFFSFIKDAKAKEFYYFHTLTGLLNAPCVNAPFCEGSSGESGNEEVKIDLAINDVAKFNSVSWEGEITVPFTINLTGNANVDDVVMSSTINPSSFISKVEFTGSGANRNMVITKVSAPLSKDVFEIQASLGGEQKDTASINVQLAGNCNNPIDKDGHTIYCNATGNVYLLSSVDDLLHISKNQKDSALGSFILSGAFELTNDITFDSNFSNVDWNGSGVIGDDGDENGWMPIGSDEVAISSKTNNSLKITAKKIKDFFSIANSYALGMAPGGGSSAFSGEFYGKEYSIKNLYINRSSESQGFFGKTDGALVRNLEISNANISGYRMVGALVGYANNTSIETCSSSGQIKAGNSRSGGLLGEINNSNILNSFSTANLVEYVNPYDENDKRASHDAGGLIGRAFSSDVNGCYAKGSVKAEVYAGGLIGYVEINTTISSSYATGNVESEHQAGGLVGSSSGDINNCYATGDVIGTNDVGGLVGTSGSNISNSYATGSVLSDNKQTYDDPGTDVFFVTTAGGLVGRLDSSNKTISSSYATGAVTSKFEGAFQSSDNVNPLAGGLVGLLNGSTKILDSYATGNVKAESSLVDSYAGGLVARVLSGAIVESSYAKGSVSSIGKSSGAAYAGGLIGATQFKGYASSNVQIKNSYAAWSSSPSVSSSSTSYVGGLIGAKEAGTNGTTVISNIQNKCSGIASPSPVSCSVDDAKIIKTSWNDSIWERLEDISPKLEWENSGNVSSNLPEVPFACDVNTFLNNLDKITEGSGPFAYDVYLIGGLAGNADLAKKQLLCLSKFSNDPISLGNGETYKLTANVDFGSPDSVDWDSSGVIGDAGDANGWIPMGTESNPFRSDIEGNNKTISNLYINRKAPYQGLIGYTSGVFVEELTLNNVIIDAQQSGNVSGEYIGALAGYAEDVIFQDITINVNSIKGYNYVGGLVGKAVKEGEYQTEILFATVNSGDIYAENNYVGGIAGSLFRSLIQNSSSSSDIESDHYTAGGLVGYLKGKVEDSYATGSVDGYKYTGGLVGRQSSSPDITVHVKRCYATGNVESSNDYVGGLIGYISDGDGGNTTVEKSYATGNVDSSNDEGNGGLIGYAKDSAIIKNCYATGNVKSGAKYVGGLIGYSNATITNCYATGEVKGSDSRIGGLVGYASSDSDITNSYANWSVAPSGPSYIGGLIGRISSSGINMDNESGYCEYINESTPTSCSSSNISSIQGGANYGAWDSSIWNLTGSSPTLKNMP